MVQPVRPRSARRLGVRRAASAAALVAAAGAGVGYVATRALAARAERAFPAIGTFVEVAGLRQHVLVRGPADGAPVVLVHGAFGGLHDWSETILDDAARRWHCLAWDRPGHGYSEREGDELGLDRQARLLLDVARELGLERPLVVGFSLGGSVALTAAVLWPDEVRGVVLLNAPTHPWRDPLAAGYTLPTLPLLGTLATETVIPPIGRLLAGAAVARAFRPSSVPPDFFERSPVALALRPASYRANAADVRSLKPFLHAQAPRYAELVVPVTAVVSRGDRIVSPLLHAPALRAAAPAGRVRVVEVPDTGHQILYTRPERVLEIVAEALAASAP